MTIHYDALRPDAPPHYYCEKCGGAKHWRGSTRYQSHFAWRAKAERKQGNDPKTFSPKGIDTAG